MKRLAFVLGTVTALATLLSTVVFSDDEKIVNATVTPIVIAIEVSPANITYDQQEVNTSDIPSDPTFFAIFNRGSVPEDFKIRGENSLNWTLASTPGDDEYVHSFSITNGPTFAPLTTTYVQIADEVQAEPTDGEIDVFMRLTMPTSSSVTTQQTLPIRVLAVAD
jgi:hypothetical protein